MSSLSQGYGSFCESTLNVFHKRFDATPEPFLLSINHQMDVGLIKILERLEREVLKALTRSLSTEYLRLWYRLFIVFCILLYNLGELRSQAVAHDIDGCNASIPMVFLFFS